MTATPTSIFFAGCLVVGFASACSDDTPAPQSGGAPAGGSWSGGSATMAGSSLGGSSKGGSSAAGSGMGGFSTGGSATAGSSAGGVSAGGSATAGSSAGGVSASGGTTGGAATGGSGGRATGDCPFELVGWATHGPGTVGGGNLTPVMVTSASQLSSSAGGNEPRVIHLSGTVDTGGASITVGSNKTIRGVDANARIVGGLSIRGNNVIVQNLTVQGNGQGNSPADAINSTGASNVWFDHLNVLDGGDGLMDLTNGSTYVTVSWSKFWYTDPGHSHRLALLFGNGSEKCDVDRGKQNHTVHHNWFSDLVDSRQPRLLFGKGHVFNNFYNSPGNNYCVGSGSWGSILIQNNYFKDVKDPHRFQDAHPSYMKAEGNVYDRTSGSRDTGLGGSEGPSNECERGLEQPGPWTPPYAYVLDSAESVPELTMRCAGPQ